MAKERITIEKLATMVAGGFTELRTEMREGFRSVNARLDVHDRRFDDIDGQLSDHSNRLGRIETKLDNTIARVDDHSVRIDRLEKTREH